MIEAILIVLVFGALISAIWGRKAAQGCLKFGVQAILCLVAGVLLVVFGSVAAPIVVPVAVLLGLIFVVRPLFQKGMESAEDWQTKQKYKSYSPAGTPKTPSRPQQYVPRARTLTRMKGTPPPNAKFMVTYIRGANPMYRIREEVTGKEVNVTPKEFQRDWVPSVDMNASLLQGRPGSNNVPVKHGGLS